MSEQDLEDFERGYHPARYDRHHLQAMTGIRSRCLHYYVERRLIPPAIGSGPSARYTYEHVVRLKVLEKLKERGLTLQEIKCVLDGYTVSELHGLANSRDPCEVIRTVRCYLGRPSSGWPPKDEPLARVVIRTGVELHIARKFHARAVMRAAEVEGKLDEILDLEVDRDDEDEPELPEPGEPEAGGTEPESHPEAE